MLRGRVNPAKVFLEMRLQALHVRPACVTVSADEDAVLESCGPASNVFLDVMDSRFAERNATPGQFALWALTYSTITVPDDLFFKSFKTTIRIAGNNPQFWVQL